MKRDDMKAVILAGGIGSRLRPLTFSIPKPLLPVGETPILEIILNKLKSFGIDEIILAVGYKSELIETYFGDGKKMGVKIEYVEEKEPLGTAGPLAFVKRKVGKGDSIILMNGDILTKLDFGKLIETHNSKGADITIAVREYEQRSPFGVIEMEGDTVKEIREKPTFNYDISAGIYVIKSDVIEMVPEGKKYDMPELIKEAMSKGKNVMGFKFDDYWMGVERIENYEEALSHIEEWK
jgi:NDP-sugar pyrophosphorylase family protein